MFASFLTLLRAIIAPASQLSRPSLAAVHSLSFQQLPRSAIASITLAGSCLWRIDHFDEFCQQ
jgi:hypothetical protein